jgi:serine/threonine protein kinase
LRQTTTLPPEKIMTIMVKDNTIEPPGATLSESTDPREAHVFADTYAIHGDPIAKGSFGQVYVACHQLNVLEEYAVKVVDRVSLSQRDNDAVFREVAILKDCRDVTNIVRLVDFFVSPRHFHVVQVLAQGGDVFDRLASKTSYNEKHARDLAHNLLVCMQALHDRGLAHRDLKPENLLLRDLIDDASILVADFGFATYVPADGLKTRCGTPAFVAPEVLVADCRYDSQVDMWSVGCLLYMLLGGYPPFQDRNHRGLFRKIRGADFCFHEAYWKDVSVEAKQLLAGLLTTNPKFRLTATQALDSKWLKVKDHRLENIDLSSSIRELKRFQARIHLKGAMHAVLWSVKKKFRISSEGFSKQIRDWDQSDEANSTDNASKKDDDDDKDQAAALKKNPMGIELRPTMQFRDVYELTDKIHASQQAMIWECKHIHTGKIYAAKVWNIAANQQSVLGKSLTETVLHEVAVLRAIKHKYLMEIVDFFEEGTHLYLVMERMAGGDVFDRILKRKHYTEKDARDFARILLEGVAHIHEQGIAHRDLKPQNLLLSSTDDDADIKIADFGFACRVHTPMSLTTRCGTPSYVAPEILKNSPYDQRADMWSVGVILFVLLAGYPPFVEENQMELFARVRSGEWDFAGKEWENVSPESKEVISHLLVIDPVCRWTAQQCLQSDWLYEEDAKLFCKDLSAARLSMRRRKMRLVNVTRTVMWMKAKSDKRLASDNTGIDESMPHFNIDNVNKPTVTPK